MPVNEPAPVWAADLAAALPEASVGVWEEGDPPSDYAVVWKPAQRFIDAQTALKAIFNAGAGVDALASLWLPKNVPVIRLEDAGPDRVRVTGIRGAERPASLKLSIAYANGWKAVGTRCFYDASLTYIRH